MKILSAKNSNSGDSGKFPLKIAKVFDQIFEISGHFEKLKLDPYYFGIYGIFETRFFCDFKISILIPGITRFLAFFGLAQI